MTREILAGIVFWLALGTGIVVYALAIYENVKRLAAAKRLQDPPA